jgi:hypothetical protein
MLLRHLCLLMLSRMSNALFQHVCSQCCFGIFFFNIPRFVSRRLVLRSSFLVAFLNNNRFSYSCSRVRSFSSLSSLPRPFRVSNYLFPLSTPPLHAAFLRSVLGIGLYALHSDISTKPLFLLEPCRNIHGIAILSVFFCALMIFPILSGQLCCYF